MFRAALLAQLKANDQPRSAHPLKLADYARELCTELNVGFSELETILITLEYHKVCAGWVPKMLTQGHKDHRMQVCQDLLDCPTTSTI
jgi:hypothetical protein